MSTEEKVNAEVENTEENVEAAAEDIKEEVEAPAAEAEEKAEEAVSEAEDAASETAEEGEEEVKKSAKQLKKEAKAEKKAAKAAAEAEAAAAAKKKVSTKTVALVTIAICAVAIIGLVMFLNQPEKSLYEKIGSYDEYVKLGKYKGLEYTKEKISVSKKEIKAEIDNRLAAKATTTDSKKGTVKDGDNVNISYVGKINGKEFDGGSAENQTLTIGSGAFIDGFEDGLIGKNIGDKVTLDLKFPKDYSKNATSDEDRKAKEKLDGKAVVFEVTINSKSVTKTPEYNEEFIKANSDFDNKKDYEKSIKEELTKSKEETAESTAKQTLWSEAVENAKVKKNPKGAIKQEQDAIIEQYKLMAQNYNMEWEDFLKTYMQTTDKDFQKQAKTYAKSVVKQKLVLYAIADKEKLNISNKDYKDRLEELLKNAGMTKDQFKEQYNMTIDEYAEKNDFKANFLSEKVNDFIYKNAKAKSGK